MEARNSGADSQTSDQSQPIQELNGEKIVGDSADAAGAATELGNGADFGKKKRGRPPRVQAKSPPVKMVKEEDEDVCFICFDGGSLVLCDRRGCPKAYHPACVKRDDAFFRSKAKWNCGWHICSICQRAAHHMCYTCTYSLCKACIKKADYVCVRGDKGFCTVCMKTIMLIENGGQEKDEKAQVDFDDKTSWEYLFKVYWIYLKGKLSLTLDEITQAKNPLKEASSTTSVVSSTCVHNGDNDVKNIPSDMSQNLEANESKRRKTDEQISIVPHKEPVTTNTTCVNNVDNDVKNVPSDMSQNMEASESRRRKSDEQNSIVPHKESVTTKKPRTDERSPVTALKDWATKELLDFVAHMKNGDTSVLSQFDVQELMLEYIKRNNLRDPRKKSQIVCDSRLKILFGKPRVGHFEMLKLLEFHFFINEDLSKNTIKSIARHVDPDWNIDNVVTVGKEKKRRNHKKTEEHVPQNKVDEYAAIDVHNMNLIYLRRKFMENLIEDRENFQKKVVGSIVRIRITGKNLKHDMYRLVQVVGTSKADAPYKVGNKIADVVLEVLNLDKKETVSIDTISNQDLSEDECRRLRQSIKCGLVKCFTVGEIQDKAVSLQSTRINDLMEAERLRLNNLRDRASEKGHKKSLREYVEKLQLLKTPEERERRLREIPEVHSDPKMNPDYESDDTEEYFNKEHGEHTTRKYTDISRKITSSIKKGKDVSNNVNGRAWKNEEGLSSTKATGRVNMKHDAHKPSSSGRSQSQVDYNGSTVTNRSHNSASETSTSSFSMKNSPVSNDSELDKIWHYRDPSGKIQGPFCMLQLQKWSTTGYFPQDMRIWTNREEESLLLNDVLKQQLNTKTATDNVGIRVEGLTVRTTNLSSPQIPVNLGKSSGTLGSMSQSSVQSWTANDTTGTLSFGKSNMADLASPTPAGKDAGISNVSSVFNTANADVMDLPSPTPKETTTHVNEKVQNDVDTEAGKVSGAQIPETGKEWTAYSPTDRVVTTPRETRTHVDEKVQKDVDTDAGKLGGAQPPETGKEWTAYSPTDRIVTTPREVRTHVDEKTQNDVDTDAGKLGGAQPPETGKEWTAYSPTDRVVTTPKEITALLDEKVQNDVDTEAGKVGGAQPLETGKEWTAYSPTDCVVSTPKEMTAHVDEKVQNDVDTEAGQVGGAQPPETGKEWTAYSPTDRIVTMPKETTTRVDEKVQNDVDTEARRVDGAHLLETGKEWTAYSPTDCVVTTSANMEQAIPSSSQPSTQPENNDLPAWQGVRETIEFSTLAEESVSDLLAEVDAMEAQNGYPSPTSRRNSFVEDLFSGSFEDFSPTPDINGSRSNVFSSNGAEIHLSFQPTTTATTTNPAATTTSPIIAIATTTSTTAGSSQGNSNNVSDFVTSSMNLHVKWPEMPQDTNSKDNIDVNTSIKADEQESEANVSESRHAQEGGSSIHNLGEHTEPTTTELKDLVPELVLQLRTNHKEAGDGVVQPATVDTAGPSPQSLPLPQPLAIGSDKGRPRQGNMYNFARPAQELTQVAPHLSTSRGVVIGWDPHQQSYGGERFNKVEDSGYSRNSKPWVRQASFGNGNGNGGGNYSRAPPKGQRVCKFYESGRCKKGASCNYWHP